MYKITVLHVEQNPPLEITHAQLLPKVTCLPGARCQVFWVFFSNNPQKTGTRLRAEGRSQMFVSNCVLRLSHDYKSEKLLGMKELVSKT